MDAATEDAIDRLDRMLRAEIHRLEQRIANLEHDVHKMQADLRSLEQEARR